MQASTKASTLGLGCLLIGSALQMGDFASFFRAATIGGFVLLTTPVSGLVIARAAYLADVPLWEGTVLDDRKRDSYARLAAARPRKTIGTDMSTSDLVDSPPLARRQLVYLTSGHVAAHTSLGFRGNAVYTRAMKPWNSAM